MPDKKHTIESIGTDIEWIKGILGDLPDHYSKKWVQTLVTGFVSTILVAVIGAIMGLILVKPLMNLTYLYINLIT